MHSANTVDFAGFFPDIKQKILSSLPGNIHSDVPKRLDEILSYNVPGGKLNRGKSVYESYAILNSGLPAVQSDEMRQKMFVLGWCVELLQAAFLVADDIMDGSETRRGHKCWYLKDRIGLSAINDAFILESCLYNLLREYFREESYYSDLLDLFHSVTFMTEIGQSMDLMTAENHAETMLSTFTRETYNTIVVYKTAYYSFYLPVALAMIASGIKDQKAFQKTEELLLYLGEFFQIQDDFLDCFGDPAVTGKIGTDIEDCKCSWLIVEAISKANHDEIQIIKENYGRKEQECVQRIKDLYQKMGIPLLYQELEKETQEKFNQMINSSSDPSINPQVFSAFARKIFKRQK